MSRVQDRFALWDLGFRPFYLLASMFAALSGAMWALQFAGWLPWEYLPAASWHAHEMLFGFTTAVVVGFLFTAGRNWSGQATPSGRVLAALAGLWVLGRVLVLTPYGWVSAVVNAAFPLAAAIGLGMALVAARNRRNYFFIGVLVALSAATLLFHLSRLDVVAFPGWVGIGLALDLILFVLCVMGGRVIPMFTNNGVPGAGAVRDPRVEKIALGLVLALLAADVLHVEGLALAGIALLAAVAHAVRWGLWKPWRTLRVPLVWVLHAAYAWIPVHLALRAAAAAGLISASPATHALTAGAIGGLVIGMMTRTARGHSGRPLVAGKSEIACYAMVLLGAVIRVFVPLLAPQQIVGAVLCAAVLWSLAFGLYAVRYWPILTRQSLS